jgi:hypothetical protein
VAGFGTTIGAGHQTGRTVTTARIMHLFGTTRVWQFPELGKTAL